MLIFVFSNSSWELGSSSPENERENLPILCDMQLMDPVVRDLPRWLGEYILNFDQEKRMAAFESWKHSVLYGFCCPLAWMHRECIVKFAISAALHFLKCPYCANKKIFIRSLIDGGIWIPDRYNTSCF